MGRGMEGLWLARHRNYVLRLCEWHRLVSFFLFFPFMIMLAGLIYLLIRFLRFVESLYPEHHGLRTQTLGRRPEHL